MTFAQQIQNCQVRLDQLLDEWLPVGDKTPSRLHQAMRYSSLKAGKRLRPLLVYLSGDALGANIDDLDASALAVECIHVYSLIHDDLPAMDDDDLRRGKPTCHIAFDEATAILAGDALQSMAFEILANHHLSDTADVNLIKLINILAKASGSMGMGGGQMIDLQATDKQLNLEQLIEMHRMKTGALITACVEMSLATANITDKEHISALIRYADRIGLAFQVKDDILDIESDTQTLGKPTGSDIEMNKSTFPALLGLESARKYAHDLISEALLTLEKIPYNTGSLKALAKHMIQRDY